MFYSFCRFILYIESVNHFLALQQGLIPVPQTSQPLPIINSVGTSHNLQSPICRLNSSLSFPATSNILKVNGTSSLHNKDTSKSGQAVAESSSTHGME